MIQCIHWYIMTIHFVAKETKNLRSTWKNENITNWFQYNSWALLAWKRSYPEGLIKIRLFYVIKLIHIKIESHWTNNLANPFYDSIYLLFLGVLYFKLSNFKFSAMQCDQAAWYGSYFVHNWYKKGGN
jgi:hypothetical protein